MKASRKVLVWGVAAGVLVAQAGLISCGGKAGRNGDGDGDGDGDLGGADGAGETEEDEFGAGGAPSGGAGNDGSGGHPPVGGSGGSPHINNTCFSGTWDVNPDRNIAVCEPWSNCEPGTYIKVPGSYDRDVECAPCEDGFATGHNHRSCSPWTECQFYEEETAPPTKVYDRSCEEREDYPLFLPQYYYGLYGMGPLTVTSQGVHALYNASGAYRQYSAVVRYSSGGEASVLVENRQIADLAAVGNDLIYVGWNTTYTNDTFTEFGYIQRRAGSSITWQKGLEADADDHWRDVRVVVHGGEVYVVSLIEHLECMFDVSAGGNICETAGQGAQRLLLQKFSDAGQAVDEIVLEEDTNARTLDDFQIGSDGQLYLAVTRGDWNGTSIAHKAAVWQYSPDGEREGEHPMLDQELEVAAKLTPGPNGTMYALARSAQSYYEPSASLYRFEAGEQLLAKELPDWVQAFATTEDGLVLVGSTSDAPKIAYTDPSGEVDTEDELEDVAPMTAADVAFTVDGVLIVAGASDRAFVRPWPE